MCNWYRPKNNTYGRLKKNPCPPPLAEQKRIVTEVESLLGMCEGLQSQLGLANEERERLLSAVLYGIVKDEG